MNNKIDENVFETVYIKDEISRCEDVEELKERIFPMIATQQDMWLKKINTIFEESTYGKSKFAEMCGVSRVTLDKWLNKGAIPKNRETFLKIGMAAGFDTEKMNQLLQRYGRYPGLYAKSLEDCVSIFVLDHKYGEETLEKYKYILDKIKSQIIRDESSGDSDDMETELFNERLSEVKDENELDSFIAENSTIFANAYNKFYSYVKMCIEYNYADSTYELAEAQNWTSSLRQCVSAINQKKWYPTRNKIISLGLHLSMDHEQIDEMLELAHMEPLCAKNVFESVIMFILDDASLNGMMDGDASDPDELCRYARAVLSELEMPEIDSFISELPEENDEW